MMASLEIKQVYDPSTDTYYANQGLLLEVDLLARYKKSLDNIFLDVKVGDTSLDTLLGYLDSLDSAQKIIRHYPILGKNLIRSLLAERIRNYIDRAESIDRRTE